MLSNVCEDCLDIESAPISASTVNLRKDIIGRPLGKPRVALSWILSSVNDLRSSVQSLSSNSALGEAIDRYSVAIPMSCICFEPLQKAGKIVLRVICDYLLADVHTVNSILTALVIRGGWQQAFNTDDLLRYANLDV